MVTVPLLGLTTANETLVKVRTYSSPLPVLINGKTQVALKLHAHII